MAARALARGRCPFVRKAHSRGSRTQCKAAARFVRAFRPRGDRHPRGTGTDQIAEARHALTRSGRKRRQGSDLAEIDGVTTKRLNEQVKRNRERFPEDFMFQLTKDEVLA
ncbi:MAG: ORF6N domain-containing protein [Planctomycetota bacterium]